MKRRPASSAAWPQRVGIPLSDNSISNGHTATALVPSAWVVWIGREEYPVIAVFDDQRAAETLGTAKTTISTEPSPGNVNVITPSSYSHEEVASTPAACVRQNRGAACPHGEVTSGGASRVGPVHHRPRPPMPGSCSRSAARRAPAGEISAEDGLPVVGCVVQQVGVG